MSEDAAETGRSNGTVVIPRKDALLIKELLEVEIRYGDGAENEIKKALCRSLASRLDGVL